MSRCRIEYVDQGGYEYDGMYNENAETLFIKCRDGEGTAVVSKIPLGKEKQCHIHFLEVEPQRTGIGTEALKLVEDYLREWGCRSLLCYPLDRVRGFWLKRGYRGPLCVEKRL